MNLNEIESHVEIATLIEELEKLAVETEEQRTREVKERALRGEHIFVRPAKIREVVYEYFSLHDHFEARKFMKELSTNSRKLDFYVDRIVLKVCEFFKAYGYYRKPLPKEVIERVVDYYFKAIKTSRRVYVITKTNSKKKRVKAPRGFSPKAATQGLTALGAKALEMKGSR